MPPGTQPPANPTPEPKAQPAKTSTSWYRLNARANTIASIAALFIFLLALGGIGGYVISQLRKPAQTTPKTTVQTLSPEEISKLTEIGTNLGTSGQTLNIGANSLFRGKVDVSGNLTVGGTLSANGPVTLSQLNITGTTAATGLNVGSNLIVSGTGIFQKGITVADLASFANGINVGGSASMNAINANSLAVRNLSISGPLTISHLTSQGPTPSLSTGTAVGSGGTASISGNDTAGTLNFNTGTGAPAGVLGAITFRANFSGTVHVMLTPLTGAAASTPAYVTRSAAGFTVRTDVAPPSGSALSYDYFVVQ